MKALPVLLFSGFSLCAQTPDPYPQVRSLVLLLHFYSLARADIAHARDIGNAAPNRQVR